MKKLGKRSLFKKVSSDRNSGFQVGQALAARLRIYIHSCVGYGVINRGNAGTVRPLLVIRATSVLLQSGSPWETSTVT